MLMLSTTMMINPTSVDENNWAQEIWQYSQWQILILSIIWVTGVMKSDRNVRPRKKYGLQPKQIQSNISPNLMEVSCGAGMDFPIEMKYEKQSKEIQSKVSPNLMVSVSHPPALRRFPETLWRKKSPRSPPKSEFRCMGGLINQETPLSRTFHWVEAHWKFRIRVGGVPAAVSLFGDDLFCICFDHPNRETAMLSTSNG